MIASSPQEMTLEQAKVVARTVASVTDDYEALRYNTAISRLMEFVNFFTSQETRPEEGDGDIHALALARWRLISPKSSGTSWATRRRWLTSPGRQFDPALLVEDQVEIPVQVNGKLRGRVVVPADADAAAIERVAREDSRIAVLLEGKTVRKVVVVPGKLVNFVVG